MPTAPRLAQLFGQCKDRWILRMTENCHWLNQVVTPITAAAPDVASLLEQIDASPGPWHAATALENVFPPSLSMRLSRSQMPSAGKTMHTALPCLRGESALPHGPSFSSQGPQPLFRPQASPWSSILMTLCWLGGFLGGASGPECVWKTRGTLEGLWV